MNDVHYSSANQTWGTPQWLFDRLDAEFGFTLDAAASPENALCARFFTEADDALTKDWHAAAGPKGAVYLNSPYGRALPRFIRKAYAEGQKGATVVCLIPARPDTRVWHECCAKGEIRFLKGRLRFVLGEKTDAPAPFPSAIVIFGPRAKAGTVAHVDWRSDDQPPKPVVETVEVPVTPPAGLLESMAVRLDHAFGHGAFMSDEEIERARSSPDALDAAVARQWLTSAERRVRLEQMAQVHEEVVGRGFYRYPEGAT